MPRRAPVHRRLILILFALGMVAGASAYTFLTDDRTGLPLKWPAGAVSFKIMLGDTPVLSDGTTYNSSARDATLLWNNHLGSVVFQTDFATGEPADNNGKNEVLFSGKIFSREFGDNILAVATTWRNRSRRTEADIVFNNKYPFDSYRGPLRVGTDNQWLYDLRRVMLHELGHALGLNHPNEAGQTVESIMNIPVRDIEHVTTDDITGAQRLYGPPGVPPNDAFANATAIDFQGGTATHTGFNTNASKEPGEPRVTLDPGGRSVWWRWTAPVSDRLILDTRGSHFDTMAVVYAGTALAALEPIVASYDIEAGKTLTSELTFNATAGTVYHISVDGEDSDSGGITLNLQLVQDKGTPPTIITQPASASVKAGDNVTFTVASGGTHPHAYQWLFNGNPLPGRTQGLLSLLRVTADQAGDYSVIVTNAAGSVASTSATLTVNTLPRITTQPAGVTVTTGGRASFSVTATGTAPLSYQWLFNGVAIAGATAATHEIASTTAAHAGNYSVTVTNVTGSVTSNVVTLTVNTPAPPPPSSGGGGGGGAPGWGFLAALAVLALGRYLSSGNPRPPT